MGGTVCTLSEAGRHSLGMGITYLNLMLAYAGDVLIMVASYIKFVLENHVVVVVGNHAGALAYFLLTVGCVLCFVCAAAAKANYDASSREMATRRACRMLLFTLACQGLTVLLLLAAITMCLVHKALIRDVLHNGIIAAIKLYRVNDRIKAGINRIQAGFQCCGSHSAQDWFKIPWVPLNYLDVDHPDVARYIVDGDFIIDNAPYSCCDVHVSRPCVHHHVQNVSRHLRVGPVGTLYSVGCNDRLEEYWKSNVLNPTLGLLLFITVLTALAMTLSRLLQTSLEEALEKGDPMADGDAFCIRTCPCFSSSTATQVIIHSGNKTDGKVDGGDGGDRDGRGCRRKLSSQNISSNYSGTCATGLGPAGPQGGAGEGGDGKGLNKRERSRSREGGRDKQDFKRKQPDRNRIKDREDTEPTRGKESRDRRLKQDQVKKERDQKRDKYRKGLNQQMDRKDRDQKQDRNQKDTDQERDTGWEDKFYRQSKDRNDTNVKLGQDKMMMNAQANMGNRTAQEYPGERHSRRDLSEEGKRNRQARSGIPRTGQHTRL